jgi:hypothetical protein
MMQQTLLVYSPRCAMTHSKLDTLSSTCLYFFASDVLLLVFGLRPSFVVDAFAPASVWQSLLRELTQLDRELFAPIALLTLQQQDEGSDAHDDDGAHFLLHEHTFRQHLRANAAALVRADVEDPSRPESAASPAGAVAAAAAWSAAPPPFVSPEFILVHPSLPSPRLCTSTERKKMRCVLLSATKSLLEQLDQATSTNPMQPRCLKLSSASYVPLCPTALCGFLLAYPLLYCTSEPRLLVDAADGAEGSDGSLTPQLSSTHHSGNNLGQQPLQRTVLEADLRPDWPSNELPFAQLQQQNQSPATGGRARRAPPASPAVAAAESSRTLVYSFTVPLALVSEPRVSAALAHWKCDHASLNLLHPCRSCWRTPLLVRAQSVTLPAVAL